MLGERQNGTKPSAHFAHFFWKMPLCLNAQVKIFYHNKIMDYFAIDKAAELRQNANVKYNKSGMVTGPSGQAWVGQIGLIACLL